MAKCDEGYLCCICGQDVAHISESDLYLRYVLGMVHPEVLHTAPERHIRCNPALAQFIVNPDFPPVSAPKEFDKQDLDREFCRQREELITRGWVHLRNVADSGVPIIDYPLDEFRQSRPTT